MSAYSFSATTSAPIPMVRARVESALKDEGFGILTEIDVADTLKAKLGVERSPFVILGACNPRLADRVLEIEPSIGALLPCNVVLRRSHQGSGTIVEIIDPVAMFAIAGSDEIAPIATETAERLRRVLDAVVAS